MSLSQPVTPENVQLLNEGDVLGHVAIGNNIVQIGSVYGGMVNVTMPEQTPKIDLRPVPVDLRPSTFSGLFGRQNELQTATATLQMRQPVELCGEAGIGKTALVRELAYHPLAAIFPHGVIYIPARQKSLGDLAQFLYEVFYHSQPPSKPGEAQLRDALRGRQALILLDDITLSSHELEHLTRVIAPGCTFLWTAAERNLWGEGRSITLRGLSTEQALRLAEWELQRPLGAEERLEAEKICLALEGRPLQILQAVALAQEEGYSLAAVAAQLQVGEAASDVSEQLIDQLSAEERDVLALIAVLRGVPLAETHLKALVETPQLKAMLDKLLKQGLIQAHSPSYTLAGSVEQTVRRLEDVSQRAERVLTYFIGWAETHRREPNLLGNDLDALQQMLAWAVENQRWPEALQLAQAIEGAFALNRRWDAWRQVLQGALLAAQALGIQAATGWAMHQLGTRALCLGETETARSFLSNALRLREALGDEIGAALTRHHLNLLIPPPPPPPSSSSPERASSPTPTGSPAYA